MTDGEKISEFASLVRKSAQCGTLVSVTFHSPAAGSKELKVKGRLCVIGGRRVCQTEATLTEGRVRQKNIQPEELSEAVAGYMKTFKKADLCDKNAAVSLMISKKNTVTLIKKGQISAGAADEGECSDKTSNDRQKSRLLDGSESFLAALGVSDEKGRVHDKKQSKFRQICRFSEYIIEAEKKLDKNIPLCVCDLCCGKSYLTFAVYYYLTTIRRRKVKMYGVDLKKDVMDFCRETAAELGFESMEFFCKDISDFHPSEKPDLVISLHACDIATDIVLYNAVRLEAKVILSTPCCQHEMMKQLLCPELDFLKGHPLFRQKVCDAFTDALRCKRLEAEGYKVTSIELIDPEETPKNILIKAFKASVPAEKREKALYEYRKATEFLGVRPYLDKLLNENRNS